MKNQFTLSIVLFIIISYSLIACKTSGGNSLSKVSTTSTQPVTTSTRPVVVEPTPVPVTTPKHPVRKDTVVIVDTTFVGDEWLVIRKKIFENKLVATDTLDRIRKAGSVPPPALKSSYNMVLVLPFMTNLYEEKERKSVPKKAIPTLEFYQGVKMALDDLRDDLNLYVYVLDSKNDSLTAQNLVGYPEFQTADLVVGPAFGGELKVIADFCKKKGVTHVSPLSPKDDIVGINDNYVQMNPGIKAHFSKMLDYADHIYGKNINIIAVHKDEPSENKLASDLETVRVRNGIRNAVQDVKANADGTINSESIRSASSSTATNLIFITSYQDAAFVGSALRASSNVSGRKAVFGMPKWLDDDKINIDTYGSMDVIISRETFEDMSDTRIVKFRKRYFQSFNIPPSDASYKGYDYMTFIGNALKKYGTSFKYYLNEVGGSSYYSLSKFDFQPIYENKNQPLDGRYNPNARPAQIRYYENQSVQILKFSPEDFRFVKAD
jgi:hypothetical protein